MLLHKVRWFSVVCLFALLIGCSSSEDVETYLTEDVDDALDKLEKVNEDTETFIDFIVDLKSEEAFELLKTELIPEWENIRDDLKAKELDNDDIIKFNDTFIEVLDRILTKQKVTIKVFEEVLEQQNREEIHTLDLEGLSESIHESNQDYHDAAVAFNEGIVELVESYDLEWEDEDSPRIEVSEILDLNETTDDLVFRFTQGVLMSLEGGEEKTDSSEGSEEESGENDETEITYSGEIEVNDTLSLHGKTNLLPGATLSLDIFEMGTENPSLDEEMTVNEDGSFGVDIDINEDDLNGIPVEVRVSYNPETGSVEEQELYGEEGEKLTGSFARKFTNAKRTRIGAIAHAYIELEKDVTESLIDRDWDQPDDYGESNIWMEVENIKKKDDYYDLYLKSNLLELSHIDAMVQDPGYDIAGATSRTSVLPDGSFRFQIPRPDIDSDDMYIVIEANGTFAIETEEVYGENGENFKGDLVEETNKGQQIRFEFPVEN